MIFIMSKEIEEEYQERRLGVRISLLTIDCKRGGATLNFAAVLVQLSTLQFTYDADFGSEFSLFHDIYSMKAN